MMGGNVSDGTTKANLVFFGALVAVVMLLLRGCLGPDDYEPEGVTQSTTEDIAPIGAPAANR